jgi:hypothetical protein
MFPPSYDPVRPIDEPQVSHQPLPDDLKKKADDALHSWQASYESIADIITPNRQ